MNKITYMLLIIGMLAAIGNADVWKENKQIDKIGFYNYSGATYCYFSISSDAGRFCFNVAGDYGKSRLAYLINAKNNSSHIDIYVSDATVCFPSYLCANVIEIIRDTGL